MFWGGEEGWLLFQGVDISHLISPTPSKGSEVSHLEKNQDELNETISTAFLCSDYSKLYTITQVLGLMLSQGYY